MTKPSVRQRRAGGARRELVLDAVIEVLTERGYERSRFADVSAASGVAISTLQNYFGSREDMLIEALFRASDQEVDLLNSVAQAQKGPWQQLVALIERSLSTPTPTQRMVLEFWCAAMHDEELRAKTQEFVEKYREPFLTAVLHGRRDGVFDLSHDAHDIVDVLIATLAGALVPSVLGHNSPSRESMRGVLLHQLSSTLGIDIARS